MCGPWSAESQFDALVEQGTDRVRSPRATIQIARQGGWAETLTQAFSTQPLRAETATLMNPDTLVGRVRISTGTTAHGQSGRAEPQGNPGVFSEIENCSARDRVALVAGSSRSMSGVDEKHRRRRLAQVNVRSRRHRLECMCFWSGTWSVADCVDEELEENAVPGAGCRQACTCCSERRDVAGSSSDGTSRNVPAGPGARGWMLGRRDRLGCDNPSHVVRALQYGRTSAFSVAPVNATIQVSMSGFSTRPGTTAKFWCQKPGHASTGFWAIFECNGDGFPSGLGAVHNAGETRWCRAKCHHETQPS